MENEDLGEMLDTSPRNRAKYYELLRRLTPQQRAEKAANLSRMVRGLALESIRQHSPHATDEELRTRLAVRLYGRDVARRMYNRIPDDAR